MGSGRNDRRYRGGNGRSRFGVKSTGVSRLCPCRCIGIHLCGGSRQLSCSPMGAVKLSRLPKLTDLLQELDPVAKSDKAGNRPRPEIRLEFPVEPVIDFFEAGSSGFYMGDDIALGREIAGELLFGHRYGIG